MLLKNAKVCKNIMKLVQNNSGSITHDISFLGGIKKVDGTFINTIYNNSGYSMCSDDNRYFDYAKPVSLSFSPLGINTVSNSDATFNIQLGSGNITPTENDYKLASTYNLTTNFLPLTKSSTLTVKGDNSGVIFTMKQHFQAVTALTISEIGLSNAVAMNSSTSFYHVLLTRDVLTTPLEVSAGQGFTLRVSVEQPFSEI